ncbi:ParB N-terminal domain-containing protein [Actinophytocola algeriensis]|uniref:ParB-like chromosome segregation protein Spo0J n=1 Tax=Actinophytocola algeriensis TaxID=1768010 RepID=A0A7W7QDU4_9PSEU|nr:ParB N-terminal domain-containing protein [Actinophytocola algeriensis]MBB4911633.1 ParB-like chromosome segregation protein Spo0J [Actinophytocola algeriensis]MBE1473379.1 ParB-like chromosome segregation protein Spo0J [Actinophytocola algeriensis]
MLPVAGGPPRDDGRFSPAVVPVGVLRPADSPRLRGENAAHSRKIADSGEPLPPILVHRQTMRVIDGTHRLRAARLRGDETVAVRFFSGGEDIAFVLAVESNLTHGLPLTQADREAAAARIVAAFPEWSDRAIAESTGLTGKSVRAIRRCAAAELPQPHARLGRDGRVRPISSAEGRRLASRVIAARPEASLREVAKIAGISPGTVRDVRRRMQAGEDPIPERQLARERGTKDAAPVASVRDRFAWLRVLKDDPSLRFSDGGRDLLRWLDGHDIDRAGWEKAAEAVPAHCATIVAELARRWAREWQEFAEEVEQAPGRPELRSSAG